MESKRLPNFSAHKARLTRAVNRSDVRERASAVAAACELFAEAYDGFPLPDDWARWTRAYDDARFKLAYETGERMPRPLPVALGF